MTDMIRRFRRAEAGGKRRDAGRKAEAAAEKIPEKGSLRVTSLGITTLLFDDGETKLLFDGMVTRPSLFCVLFRRIGSDEKLVKQLINDQGMDNLRGIFVSHTHYDHVLDVPNFSKYTGADIYASSSGMQIALGNGILKEQLHVFSGDEEYRIGKFTVRILRSVHSKATVLNNDLGKEITEPFSLPAAKSRFTEGGSFDFYVAHGEKRILIRPSCNYIEGSLQGIRADVLFLGIARYSKLTAQEKDIFYRETVETVKPDLVIPIHWDNFFLPMKKGNRALYRWMDDIPGGTDHLRGKLERDGIVFQILAMKETIEI